jgi:hypothetical protein
MRPGGGGDLRHVRCDAAQRRDDQADQADQDSGQPIQAAVRGDAPRELAEFSGEALQGSLGRGCLGHAGDLEHIKNVVKRFCACEPPRGARAAFAARSGGFRLPENSWLDRMPTATALP